MCVRVYVCLHACVQEVNLERQRRRRQTETVTSHRTRVLTPHDAVLMNAVAIVKNACDTKRRNNEKEAHSCITTGKNYYSAHNDFSLKSPRRKLVGQVESLCPPVTQTIVLSEGRGSVLVHRNHTCVRTCLGGHRLDGHGAWRALQRRVALPPIVPSEHCHCRARSLKDTQTAKENPFNSANCVRFPQNVQRRPCKSSAKCDRSTSQRGFHAPPAGRFEEFPNTRTAAVYIWFKPRTEM